MNNGSWPKHLYALDVSRGLAALSVVLWHWQHFAYQGTSLPGDFVREAQPLYGIFRLFYEKGAMGVEYFFLLSGFIFFWRYKASIQNRTTSAWRFTVQRFSRLYPLHLITLIVVAILQAIYFHREGVAFVYPANDAYHFLLNLCFASSWGFEHGGSFNDPVRTVCTEVLLYFVFFLSVFFRQGGWLFCLFVSVTALVFYHISYREIFDGLECFFWGGLVFQLTFLLSNKKQLLKTLIYCLTMFVWLCVISNYYFLDLTPIALGFGKFGKLFLMEFPSYILFPLTISSLALIEIDKGAFVRPIAWIGDITYSSYLIHFPLQLLFKFAVIYGILNSKFYLNPLYLLLYFLILIPLSYVIFLKFERPMQTMLRHKLIKSNDRTAHMPSNNQ